MSTALVGQDDRRAASDWEGLAAALARLDQALARAVAARRAEFAPPPVGRGGMFPGLVIGDDEIDHLLARPPGGPDGDPEREGLGESDEDVWGDESFGPRFAWLGRCYGLVPFDLGVVLLALAPHVDGKYGRIYAYLHDDITRRRPSVGLALELLGRSPADRLALRGRFAAGAPLRRHGLVSLAAEPDHADSPLPARALVLDAQVVDVLTGQVGLDDRLVGFCRLVTPRASLAWLADEPRLRGLAALVAGANEGGGPLRLYFHGPAGRGQLQAAESLARSAGAPLLVADLGRSGGLNDSLARVLVREVALQGAALFVDGLDAEAAGPSACDSLAAHLADHTGIAILAGSSPWPTAADRPGGVGPLGVMTVPFDPPGAPARLAWWREALADHGVALDDESLATLADRFRLGPEAIAEAAASGTLRARLRAAEAGGPPVPVPGDFAAAARSQTGRELATLAWRIEPRAGWSDLVVPDDTRAQLEELCRRAAGRRRVMVEWGFARKLSRGRGVNALLAGPSGVGKTLAAEVVASTLGLDLYVIDLAGVVSKYIGETEKNLDRVFEAAEAADAVLVFDEAEALFGKRFEAREARDRFANIEVSYLLQKIELYEGVALLATNLKQNLDDAFLRRLAFTISFPFPDEPDRRRIWSAVWPAEAPLSADVDLDDLARRFKLSGGQIKNVALAAAHLAATGGGPVTMADLRHAVRREFQKLGRVLTDAELVGDAP